jgi:predicted Zn finger-like uncharacterized protein
MILTCPECSTRYHVDPASLGGEGRAVRCANCGHRWTAKPPPDTPKVIELTPPAAAVAPRVWHGAAPEQAPSRGSVSLVGWLVGVLVVLVLASAVIGRNEIVAAFPASASIYQKLGFPLDMQLGLKLEEVTSKSLTESGVTILVVEGAIVNATDQDRPVPPVRVILLDGDRRELRQEVFTAKDTHLGPGGRTSFSGRLVNPAEQARNFAVTFEPIP